MQVEHPVEITHLEHPANPRLGNDDPEIAVEQPHPLQRADHHPQPERVDEIDAGEVQHQVTIPLVHLAHHLPAQIGAAHDIELSGDRENRPGAITMWVRHDLHSADRTSPARRDGAARASAANDDDERQRCDSVTPRS